MPKIGLTIDEAEVVEWLVSIGDDVLAGQPLVLVNADKTELEIEAPHAGTLMTIHAAAGDVVTVGEALGSLAVAGQAGDTNDVPVSEKASSMVQPAASAAHAPIARDELTDVSDVALEVPRTRPIASPRAKHLARQRRIDLMTLRGTGPGGRIVERDIAALPTEPPSRSPNAQMGGPAMIRATAEVKIDRGLILQRKARSNGNPVTICDIVIAALSHVAGPGHRFTNIVIGTMLSPRPTFTSVRTGPTTDAAASMSSEAVGAFGRARADAQRHGTSERPTGDLVVLDATESNVSRLEPELWDGVPVTVAIGSVELRPVVVRGQFDAANVVSITIAADPTVWTSFAIVDLLGRLTTELEGLPTFS